MSRKLNGSGLSRLGLGGRDGVSVPSVAAEISWVRIFWLMVFLLPFSVTIGTDGTSVNYLFAFLVLLAPWGYRKNIDASVYVVFMFVSYAIGLIFLSGSNTFFIFRQGASFLVALAPVLLLFTRIGFTLDEICKATVVVSVAYSLWALFSVFTHGLNIADYLRIKDELSEYVPDWPQRFVMILMFAFFVALDRIRFSMLYALAFVVIGAVIFLTFLRAAYLSVFVGALCYWWARMRSRKMYAARKQGMAMMPKAMFIGIVVACALAFQNESVSNASQKIVEGLIVSLAVASSGEVNRDNVSDSTRIEIWQKIIDIVLTESPFTGLGFAGIHLRAPEFGSAHNQYMDVFVRTGLIGILFYLYFWSRVLRRYYWYDPAIFGGICAFFVFGFFHETSKYSYGGLLFFLLLSKTYERKCVAVKGR